MASVTTKNGTTFECGKGQSIIDAALESGIVLEYSCIMVDAVAELVY